MLLISEEGYDSKRQRNRISSWLFVLEAALRRKKKEEGGEREEEGKKINSIDKRFGRKDN